MSILKLSVNLRMSSICQRHIRLEYSIGNLAYQLRELNNALDLN